MNTSTQGLFASMPRRGWRPPGGHAGGAPIHLPRGSRLSSNDLIGGKEKKIEEWLWSAFESMKELAALLQDLQQIGADGEAAYVERIEALERQAKLLGQILQGNDPVVLGAADAGDEPDAERGSP
jgi:hypothetical protein